MTIAEKIRQNLSLTDLRHSLALLRDGKIYHVKADKQVISRNSVSIHFADGSCIHIAISGKMLNNSAVLI